jgi:glycosyltransferase involved in cell wall biosynthesis
MNILVVSSYFGPETSVGVLRINAFVKYWANMGHQIDVITMPYRGGLPAGIKDNERIRVLQVSPFFIGGQQSSDSQGYAKGATGLKREIIQFQYWLKRRFLCNYLDPRVLWWPRVAYTFARRLKKTRYQCIFSTVPSYTAHSAAAVIKAFDKKSVWVADYRDLWSGNPIFPGCAPIRFLERMHEKFVLRSADLIISINESLVTELRSIHGGDRFLTVPNGFDDGEITITERIEASGKKTGGKVTIVYAGSILPGLQDPTLLFQAIKELSEDGLLKQGELEIRFYGDYSALNNFPLAIDQSVKGFVIRCGKVPRNEILEIQRDADFLLFLGSKPVIAGIGSTTGVVSGKIFEYLISGTEVLAVRVTDDMIVAKMITQSCTGDYYGNDVAKIKQRLLRAIQAGGAPKVIPNMSYLEQFRRSHQALKVINEVEALVR